MGVVACIGGSGTLGKQLATLYADEVDQWIVVSRGEYLQHTMDRTLNKSTLRFFIGDVRNGGRMSEIFRHKKPNIVIHAAAMKRIDTSEQNPLEAIDTNVNGTANVIRACIETGVEKCIFVGSDKDVAPTSLYGATKLLGEHLCHAANVYGKTKFFNVRYGNVFGSRGSLLEIVDKCKAEGKPVPVTDPTMSRFWLKPEDAAKLIWYVVNYATDTSLVYIPKMMAMTVGETIRTQWPEAMFEAIPIRGYEKHDELIVGHGEECFQVNELFNSHHVVQGPISSKDLL